MRFGRSTGFTPTVTACSWSNGSTAFAEIPVTPHRFAGFATGVKHFAQWAQASRLTAKARRTIFGLLPKRDDLAFLPYFFGLEFLRICDSRNQDNLQTSWAGT